MIRAFGNKPTKIFRIANLRFYQIVYKSDNRQILNINGDLDYIYRLANNNNHFCIILVE